MNKFLLTLFSIVLVQVLALHMSHQPRKISFLQTLSKIKTHDKIRLHDKFKLNIQAKHQSRVLNHLRHKAKSHIKEKHAHALNNNMNIDAGEQQTLQAMIKSKTQKKTRFTDDGQRCLHTWQYNGENYDDCVTIPTPDSKHDGDVSWCMIDKPASEQAWGICKDHLDFDKLKEEVQHFYDRYLPEMRKLTELLKSLAAPAVKLIADTDAIQNQQNQVDQQTLIQEKKIQFLVSQFQLIDAHRKQTIELEKKIRKIKVDIDAQEKLNQVDVPENCQGKLGYEQEEEGNGIIGEYYDNEFFRGEFQKITSKNIDFEWNNQSPAPGVNPDNFSIRWRGFFKVPVQGEYKFRIRSDDAFALYINDKMQIQHFMGDLDKEKMNMNSFLSASYNNYELNGEKNIEKKEYSETAWLQLFPYEKYKIQVVYYHSCHDDFKETQDQFIKLLWHIKDQPEEVVPPHYFYQTVGNPILKLYDYDSRDFSLSYMRDFDSAYKDVSNYKMADIPVMYNNFVQLKFDSIYDDDEVEFRTSGAITIYIAIWEQDPNFLMGNWKDTKEMMTVYTVSNKPDERFGMQRASQSYGYKIYEQDFKKGPIKIEFGGMEKFRFIMFYEANTRNERIISCGGEEINIALPNQEAWENCRSSSAQSGGLYDCQYAFTGRMEDKPYNIWSTDNEGIGAWIEIHFTGEYMINRIEYRDRDNSGMRNRKIMVTFNDESIWMQDLRNTESIQHFKFKPTRSSLVKFTIMETYGQQNNGGAFKIWGIPCKEIKDDLIDDVKELNVLGDNVIALTCEDTIRNHKTLKKIAFYSGDYFNANCPSTCVNYQGARVWGNNIYSEDSSICKAAAHAQIVTESQPEVRVNIQLPLRYYESSFSKGIKSLSKNGIGMEVSLSFQSPAESDDDEIKILMQEGDEVDIYDDNMKKWVYGTVQSVNYVGDQMLLTCLTPSGNLKEYTWPDEKYIAKCADKIPERICRPKDKLPQDDDLDNKKPIDAKICFTPLDSCGPGKLVDNGLPYAPQNGLIYGWNKDVSHMSRSRDKPDDFLLNNLIAFQPDPLSRYCTTDKAQFQSMFPCDIFNWSIEVPNGKYEVKATVGDYGFQYACGLLVNGGSIIQEWLNKGQFITKSKEIIVLDKKIVISQGCNPHVQNCNESWCRIENVEIKEIKDSDSNQAKSQDTVDLGCGNAYEGGRCEMKNSPNVENCLYERIDESIGAPQCKGPLQLFKIPENYICKTQRGLHKCILKAYPTLSSCENSCPAFCRAQGKEIVCVPK